MDRLKVLERAVINQLAAEYCMESIKAQMGPLTPEVHSILWKWALVRAEREIAELKNEVWGEALKKNLKILP